MKKIYICMLHLFLLCVLNACSDFDAINTNPDTPTSATAAMLATKQIKDMVSKSDNKSYFYDMMVSKHIAWGELMENDQYNRFDRADLSLYTGLTNCFKMVELAADVDKEAYQGLALFIKAFRLFNKSLELGDIPYSEALKGEEGVINPKYDTQKEVMLNVLNDLEAAYTHFSNAGRAFDGDIIYDGDPEKWKKAITAQQLKVLINLSKKEADADLNIKQRFAKLVGERTLFASNNDNLQLVYGTKASQIYPTHETKNRFIPYPMVTTTVIDTLKKYNDYRLFYYAQPATAKTESGVAADDWDAYVGIDPSLAFDVIGSFFTTGSLSNINLRYTQIETGQPTIRLGYAEQNFILAEACLRKWIDGDPASYYLKGIEAGMKFTADNTPNEETWHHGRPITAEYIQSFLAGQEIQLSSSESAFESNLNKIITQKYLNNFMHYTYDNYYEYRRTGYPKLPINPATNLNTMPDRMPVRWMYEQREYDFNKENVEEAVQRQFGGNDDVNELMWIL
ncbi:MAG: SusD/RagB family nutrient-binding outer membrane lipoprotein, partial [Tannerella sp.]|nr:SusD/RagB family nutrient-binding outer membrane lipoprotein [Tannerella sp.]